jgi:hypothetical protein
LLAAGLPLARWIYGLVLSSSFSALRGIASIFGQHYDSGRIVLMAFDAVVRKRASLG